MTMMFGITFDHLGHLVKVAVQGCVLRDVEFFGPLPHLVSPELVKHEGRTLGEGAWTALGAAHVRLA
jgi:hypothetical protein